ncbi:MAG: isoaspartyl peptidase/L-asparaginase [Novosphingobium sp.]|nr:isoaspartyl peptidase/L-asparaginase [Novosphingobium sp.]
MAATPQGYTYYSIGDAAAPTPGKTSAGLMLMGGGGWSYDAWRWFLARAGNGHIVVLRASGGADAGEEIYKEIGGAASVETLVFDDRKASSDAHVLAILAHADGIFIAGGDQSNYVRYWKDSPVARALDAHVAKGRPIGGTSAGLAILGGAAYGAMDGGSVDSIAALEDPMGPAVTIVRDFLHMPMMAHVVTDTHFTARDRLGRLIAFVAQVRAQGDMKAIGIGVDEASSLCVDADGKAKLYTMNGGHAWLVEPQGAPGATAGKPLDWAAVKVTGIGTESSFDLKTLKVGNPAFAGTARVVAGRLTGAPFSPGAHWTLAIHGGAGVISRGDLTPDQEKAYRAGLDEALAAGSKVLGEGGSSLDAVEATIRVLEDNPLFNAGRGAVFDAEGHNQLDAAIMDGATLKAGAVAGVSTTKNPVMLARAVMEHSRHVLLTGPGADQFAREQGIEQVDPGYFRTEKRWNEYLEWKRGNTAALDPTHKYGTVGAVAIDVRGHVAAATSTGGLTGKRWGRIGDSPIVGAGTYASDWVCAVSATGTGEYFIRESAARQVCDRIAWKGQPVDAAAKDTIEAIGDIGGDGGLIAIDGKGNAAFALNTEGMYRGLVTSEVPAHTAIYADEKLP